LIFAKYYILLKFFAKMDKPFLEMLLENFVDRLKDISSVKSSR